MPIWQTIESPNDPDHSSERLLQICELCGESAIFGSGKFVNRIPDFNDYETRVEMGVKYPKGDFVCGACDRVCPDCGDVLYTEDGDYDV